MREIQEAVNFLCGWGAQQGLSDYEISRFEKELKYLMQTRFISSWHPLQPLRNSGNRCIRVHPCKLDPLLAEAGERAGVDMFRLKSGLPQHLILWIDPGNVSYKTHERSPIITLYQEQQQSGAIVGDELLNSYGGVPLISGDSGNSITSQTSINSINSLGDGGSGSSLGSTNGDLLSSAPNSSTASTESNSDLPIANNNNSVENNNNSINNSMVDNGNSIQHHSHSAPGSPYFNSKTNGQKNKQQQRGVRVPSNVIYVGA